MGRPLSCDVFFSFVNSCYQFGSTVSVSAVSAELPVKHVINVLQNISTEWMPQSVFSAELPWETNSEEVKAERWKEGENAAAIPFHSNCGQQPTAMQAARLRLPLCAKFKVYSTNLAEGEWAKKVRTLVTCGKENFGYNAYCWETKGASI